MSTHPRESKTYKTAFMGIMLAMALALSFIESLLPALPFLPAGVKLGLSNIVTMYCLFFMGAKAGLTVAFLKSAFAAMMRGPVGGALSLAGGLLSVAVMLLLRRAPGMSHGVLSVAGAVSHNIGQLILACFIIKSVYTIYYLPVMILSGVVMGAVTGILLRLVMPYLRNAGKALK